MLADGTAGVATQHVVQHHRVLPTAGLRALADRRMGLARGHVLGQQLAQAGLLVGRQAGGIGADRLMPPAPPGGRPMRWAALLGRPRRARAASRCARIACGLGLTRRQCRFANLRCPPAATLHPGFQVPAGVAQRLGEGAGHPPLQRVRALAKGLRAMGVGQFLGARIVHAQGLGVGDQRQPVGGELLNMLYDCKSFAFTMWI